MAEINVIIRERCRSGNSHHIFIQLAYLACAEGPSRMTVDHCKINQLVTSLEHLEVHDSSIAEAWFGDF